MLLLDVWRTLTSHRTPPFVYPLFSQTPFLPIFQDFSAPLSGFGNFRFRQLGRFL